VVDERPTLTAACAAIATAALVAAAVTFGSSISDGDAALTAQTPTSELKGDRLDVRTAPGRAVPHEACSASNWLYTTAACLRRQRQELRIVSLDGAAAR
jgi:hypothetical protein